MSTLTGICRWFYTQSLKLYPVKFRSKFGNEMEAVFEEALINPIENDLSLILRELRDLPGSLLNAYLANWLQGGNMSMKNEYISPSTRWQAFWGALPFLAFGLVSMIGKVDSISNYQWMYANLAFYILTLLGLLIGWVRGFPLWSYSYLGWALVFAWWWTNMRTYGFDWGYRIWIPFGFTVLVAMIWARSLAPIKKFFRDSWNDWTRLSLAMFALSSWMFLIYDENHHPQLWLFILATTLVVSAGAWFFLQSSNLMGRVLSIVVSFFAAAVPMGISYLTWDWRTYYRLPQSDYWYDNLGVSPILVLFWLLILFWPALIVLIKRTVNRQTS